MTSINKSLFSGYSEISQNLSPGQDTSKSMLQPHGNVREAVCHVFPSQSASYDIKVVSRDKLALIK